LILVKLLIDMSKCNLCNLCVNYCPTYVFTRVNDRIEIDSSKCIECYACIPLCPNKAITIQSDN